MATWSEFYNLVTGRNYAYIYEGPTTYIYDEQNYAYQITDGWAFNVIKMYAENGGYNYYLVNAYVLTGGEYQERCICMSGGSGDTAILPSLHSIWSFNCAYYSMCHRSGSKYSIRTGTVLVDANGTQQRALLTGEKVAIDAYQGYALRKFNDADYLRCDGYYDASGVFHETSGLYCSFWGNNPPAYMDINTY